MAFNHLKQPTKTKNNSIFEDHVRSSGVFEVTASSVEGCLNTLRLFSLGGELSLIFFLFLFEEIATKLNRFFVVLRRMDMFAPI